MWNVKGISGIVKKEEAVDVFGKGKFELFVLTKRIRRFHGEVNGIIAGTQETERAWEDVAILMKAEWQSAVIGFRFVSSRTLRVNLKFSRVKVCVMMMWLYVLEDLNGWVGDMMRMRIIGGIWEKI